MTSADFGMAGHGFDMGVRWMRRRNTATDRATTGTTGTTTDARTNTAGPVAPTEPGGDGTWRIGLDEVAAGYPGRPVLSGLTARLPAAANTVLVGPNGSGKSTLLAVLAGVRPVTSGTVTHHAGGRPAFVAQRAAVPDALPLTVRDTVAMGRWDRLGPWRRMSARDRSVVDACMARLGITGLADRRLGDLSGGQRQRALVAQGLAQESGLLLLDEPTTGLDAAARRIITEVLADAVADGVTVVQATHDMTAARRADHCLLLDQGRLAATGPPATVLSDATLVRVWGLDGDR
ncbi:MULTISPECIES: zinc ABC transporter ATP-binding protein AztA [unclassified Streptomyces]|uniref:zinc ABC transporter ATP-binding protein AztA n=1 Tax=unclassified Streptomyces TaxID=2593676 RepID=UPI000823F908|nr:MULTISPECIES: zinc ABC transporter ATP-binding protein AztA [unclassified Streptomyces]SCK47486.1 zinc/manganese transport system ATP-binding protein [Streptomyces sp. AmelKG-E11A]